MLRVGLIHDNEGAIRRDVVGPTRDGPLRRGRAHPLADRRALTSVLLDEELDLRVPVPRVQIVELTEEVVEELVVRDEEVHLPLHRRRGGLEVRGEAVQVHVRVHADADDHVVRLPAVDALGEDSRDLATLVDCVVRVLQAGARAAAGAFAFARSWLARKPQNITAIPTNSPMYRAQESPKRAREPPAAMITAPIPIQRLNSRRERQKEYAAIPISATLPGMVKSGE